MATKTNANSRAAGKLSKTEAVRRAMQELGKEAKAAQIQTLVKDRFGVEMTIDHIYNCMSEVRKQARKKKPAAKKPEAPKAAVPTRAPTQPVAAAPARDGGQKGISLEDIQATKGLLERVGAKQLRALIDVLAR